VRLKSNRVQQASLAALVIGAGVIIVVLLRMWLGGSSDDDSALSPDDLGESHSLAPRDTGLAETKKPEAITNFGINSALTAGGDDPFASESSDQSVHKVVIRFTSDGALYAGWRYRTKGGEGSKIAARTLEVSKTVQGGLPVAQAAVQVLQTATYAKCTIIVDGVAVTTQTAKGVNHVTVCIG
jgi:hypothetical protein